MTRHRMFASLALTCSLAAFAQAPVPTTDTTDCYKLPNRTAAVDCARLHMQVKIIQLKNASDQNEANEILVAVRNMFDPANKIYLLASSNQIAIGTFPDEIARMETFIHELDVPKVVYRLNYAITELDGNKRLSTQHYSLVALDGQRTTLKQGNKVPIVIGRYQNEYQNQNSTPITQNSYLDVGISFDATISGFGNNLTLKSKIEQTSISPEHSGIGPEDPIVHQSVIEGVSAVAPGKPLILGSFDLPGTTHHLDVEITVEPIQKP